MPPPTGRAESIFGHARSITSPEARAAYLCEACGDDDDLRKNVEALLADAEAADAVHPAVYVSADTTPAAAHKPVVTRGELPSGTVVAGRYRLHEVIGRGGFGEVWRAEQLEPVERDVALKVIKLGMDSRQVIARFEAERQALALMKHPNIAQVLDGGLTEDGRPFFVMELVKGEPITSHCDKQRLSIDERLQLFMEVCRAVQHAHQKGIIHRDIKPSNILVEYGNDVQQVPKVIDFGVAKAVQQKLTAKTLFTEQGQLIGTPEYMSPEQAEMSAQDIDTRSDIYSLGVLLYELLTSKLPFDPKSLRAAGFEAVIRTIREMEPPKPSTRISSISPDESTTLAKARRVETRAFARQVRGDLDWIVMKCLEKDRSRRYESANGLAMDIKRHLDDEPVLAGPPSVAYRLGKFAKRNRGAMVVGTAIVAILITATGVSLTFAMAAERARAQESLRASQLEQVADFQASQLSNLDLDKMGLDLRQGLLREVRLYRERSGMKAAEVDQVMAELEQAISGSNFANLALTVLDENIVQRAVAAIDSQFSNQPLVRASLQQSIANSYRDLGQYESALPLQSTALETRRRLLTGEHPQTLKSMNEQGVLLQDMGKFKEADDHFREALRSWKSKSSGKTVSARDGNAEQEILVLMGNMALNLRLQNKLADAERYYRQALNGLRRNVGSDDPRTLTVMNNLGMLLKSQGKFAAAEPFIRESLESRRRVLGDEDEDTLISMNNLGGLLEEMGSVVEAGKYYRETLEVRRRILGDAHPDTLLSINNVGAWLSSQGQMQEAEALTREALEGQRRTLGDRHPDTLLSVHNLGALLQYQGKLSEAEPYAREAVDAYRQMLGEHPNTARALLGLGVLLAKQDRLSEAETCLRESLEVYHRTFGAHHFATAVVTTALADVLRLHGKPSAALELLIPNEPAARQFFKDGHAARLSHFLAVLGACQSATGAYPEAETNLQEAYSIMVETDIITPRHRELILVGFVRLYDAWQTAEPEKGYDVTALKWQARLEAAANESPADKQGADTN